MKKPGFPGFFMPALNQVVDFVNLPSGLFCVSVTLNQASAALKFKRDFLGRKRLASSEASSNGLHRYRLW
ncbi:MAG: hypothetical protein ACD_10C00546G0005 [uncultured bacterium]|nr:MAG: hypothetical protein ACD_10C00546G0005 [uncultured bacterium]